MGIIYCNGKFRSSDDCTKCIANLKYLERNGIERILHRKEYTSCQDRFLSVLMKQFPNRFNKVIDYFNRNVINNVPCCSKEIIDIINILNSYNNKLDIE